MVIYANLCSIYNIIYKQIKKFHTSKLRPGVGIYNIFLLSLFAGSSAALPICEANLNRYFFLAKKPEKYCKLHAAQNRLALIKIKTYGHLITHHLHWRSSFCNSWKKKKKRDRVLMEISSCLCELYIFHTSDQVK